MIEQSTCLATLFLNNDTKKTLAKLAEILENFKVDDQSMSKDRMAEISIDGHSYEEIHEEFLLPVMQILDPEKESSVFFRDEYGRVMSFYAKDGVLACA